MSEYVLKAYNAYVDGRGYAGEAEEVNPPALTVNEEDFRGGGMDAPIGIDMGMDKLMASFTLGGYNPEVMKLWGLADGSKVPFVLKGSTQNSDGEAVQHVVTMRGRITSMNQGAWVAGQRTGLSIEMSLRYYKYEVAGDVIYEIDPLNMIRIVNGVDQLAAHRENIGL